MHAGPDSAEGARNAIEWIWDWIVFLWLQVGILLLFVAIFDCAARIYLYATRRSDIDPRAFADAYAGASWTPEYFAEDARSSARWCPYSYWVGKRFHSRYLNINSQGLRRTWRGPRTLRDDTGKAIRIYTFGGSTMWGEGARDDYTIASWLQRMLDETPYRVKVTNYAEDGYVSTQEALFLAKQLRSATCPI